MENTQFVSVIFPTLDRGEILVNSIKDILKQDYPSFEIIVVDQTEHQEKEVIDFMKSNPKIKYIHITKKSLPHARNVAATKAKGEILLFLDDDIRIKDPNFISYHQRNFKGNVGLVGGRVVSDFSLKAPDYKETGKLKFFGLKKITHFDGIRKQEIDHAPGGNMSVYKEVFKKVGGYKEIYGGNAHLEETDFCLRVKRAGLKIIFEPKAVLQHLQYQSGGCRVQDIYELRYWINHNYVFFILENYGKLVFVMLAVRQFFWALLSAIKRTEFKMFKVMFSATIDGYRDYYA